MIIIEIPGREPLRIDHVVLDYNGTVAVDGLLLKGAGERISRLREHVKVHVLTADTYGTVTRQCEPLGVEVRTFPREGAAGCKEEIDSCWDQKWKKRNAQPPPVCSLYNPFKY